MLRKLLVAAIVWLGFAATAQAVDPDPAPPPISEGFHAFRFILGNGLNLTPVTDVEALNDDPRHGALIVLGRTEWLVENEAEVRDFLKRGGAALIATDHHLKAAAAIFGAQVSGLGQVVARDEEDAYLKDQDCPLVTDFNRAYPMFQGIDRIATNRPAHVTVRPGSRRVVSVARFPESCAIDNLVPSFAVVNENHGTPILVLSDHSVFINSMMMPTDKNDNFAFASNCIRWVTEVENDVPSRKNVLLVIDGQIVESFDVPLVPIVGPDRVPSLDDLPGDPVDVINAILAKWEDDNVHNELLLGGASSWRQILSVAAIAATLALVVYVLYRVQKSLYRVETGT